MNEPKTTPEPTEEEIQRILEEEKRYYIEQGIKEEGMDY